MNPNNLNLNSFKSQFSDFFDPDPAGRMNPNNLEIDLFSYSSRIQILYFFPDFLGIGFFGIFDPIDLLSIQALKIAIFQMRKSGYF